MVQLLTNQVPFPGQSLPEVCQSVLANEPTPISRLRPDLPPDFDHVIERALKKDREDRFDNVAALSRALAMFGDDRDHESVERINRVLGEARTEISPRTSDSPGSGRLQRSRTSEAPDSGERLSSETPETEIEYRPPTKSSRVPLFIVLLSGAALVAFVALRPSPSEEARDATASAKSPELSPAFAPQQKSDQAPSASPHQPEPQREKAPAPPRTGAKPKVTPRALAGVPTRAEPPTADSVGPNASVGEKSKPAQEAPLPEESAESEEQAPEDEALPGDESGLDEEKLVDPYESRR